MENKEFKKFTELSEEGLNGVVGGTSETGTTKNRYNVGQHIRFYHDNFGRKYEARGEIVGVEEYEGIIIYKVSFSIWYDDGNGEFGITSVRESDVIGVA